MKALKEAIAAVVQGDLAQLPKVLASTNSDISLTVANLPRLTIRRDALVNVLTAWRSGFCTAEEVQKWASFVRRGYIPDGSSAGVRPVDIEYDIGDEELIVEIIGRLDEIGDLIDGIVDEDENAAMLKALTAESKL